MISISSTSTISSTAMVPWIANDVKWRDGNRNLELSELQFYVEGKQKPLNNGYNNKDNNTIIVMIT